MATVLALLAVLVVSGAISRAIHRLSRPPGAVFLPLSASAPRAHHLTMPLVVFEHPDGRRREYDTPDAARVVDLLNAADWTPDPVCPCCKVKTVTLNGVTYTASAIEAIYSEP